jgi:hypothetical protein
VQQALTDQRAGIGVTLTMAAKGNQALAALLMRS